MQLKYILVLGAIAICVSCQSEPPSEEISSKETTSKQEAKLTPSTTEIAFSPTELLSREEIGAGWISLFDGQTQFGWRANNDVNWAVREGVIVADEGTPGLLLTSVPFADFELRCEYRLEAGGNSGLFLRTVFDPKDPVVDCYELNMCDSHAKFPTGSIVGRKKVETSVAGEGEWRMIHVRVEGTTIEATFDGQTAIRYDDNSEHRRGIGFIGLQKNEGKIEFRNIALRPLGTQPIFNGVDLSGWRVVPGSKSDFKVIDGAIHVTNGRGFLETEEAWDHFVLQADVKTNGRNLNSGIFFRAMPGTEENPSHGYEFQIHNGYEAGDRTKPVDQGTGAIFRRAEARYVVANDEEWLRATLVAYGAQFSTWVNGIQVVDWMDERDPHENPRRGRRLEAGHISLQGHDPTTDLDFRNLRMVALPDTDAD